MKKNLSIVLVLSMFLSLFANPVFAVTANEKVAYSDFLSVEESYYTYIERPKAAAQGDYSGAVTAISNAIAAVTESVDISAYGILTSQMQEIFNNEIYQNPALFYLKEASCSYNTSTNVIIKVFFTYHYSTTVIQQMKATYETAITKALSWIKTGMSDAEKALAMHDYLVLNAKYDQVNAITNTIPTLSHTAYGILVLGVGVCGGYSLAYKELMMRLNIPAIKILSNSMGHAWNMVYLGGKWYHVDVTFDDPILPAANGWYNNDYDLEGRVGHEYFLLSDSAIGIDHSGWSPSSNIANSKIYDGKYANIKSGMFWYQGYWYYNTGGSLTRSLFNLSDDDVLKAVNGNDNNYSFLGVYGNRIYYNYTVGSTSSIRKINFDGTGDTLVVTIDNNGSSVTERITELVIQNDFIKYTVYRLPTTGNATYVVRYHSIFILGDVNGDGNADGLDAGLIIDFENFFVKWDAVADAAALKAADLNSDGNVDGIDAGILVDLENHQRIGSPITNLTG